MPGGGFLKPHTAFADSEVAVPSGSIKLKYHPLMRVALLCYITFVLWCIKLPFLNAAAAFSAELIQCGAPVPSCFSMQERPSLSLGVWVPSCPTFHQVQGGCCKRFGRSGRICKGPGQSSETVLLTSWMSDLPQPPPHWDSSLCKLVPSRSRLWICRGGCLLYRLSHPECAFKYAGTPILRSPHTWTCNGPWAVVFVILAYLHHAKLTLQDWLWGVGGWKRVCILLRVGL